MSFHPDKCNVLTATRSKTEKPPSVYTLHGQELQHVSSAKYLGVTIQKNAEWDHHIGEVASRANRTLGFLRRNLRIGSKSVKETAFKSLVRPTFEYAATVWDPHCQNDINTLEAVQRRAARFVMGRHRNTFSVSQMLQELSWPHLAQRRLQARLKMFYKMVHGLVQLHSTDVQPTPPPTRDDVTTSSTREYSAGLTTV